MWSVHHLHTTCKAILFSSMLYGWMIPTIGIGHLMQQWWPTSQLTDTNWVVEEGPANTSWDFISVDGIEDNESEDNEEQEDGDFTQVDPKGSTINNTSNKGAHASSASIAQSIESKEANQSEISSIDNKTTLRPNPIGPRFTKALTRTQPSNHPKKLRTRKVARRGKCTVENPNISTDNKGWTHVPKNVVKHYSTHWKEANRLAHLSWAKAPNGERLGIRIRGISCQSPLKFTGLKRGDVVLSINGIDLQQDKDLLKVYGKLMFWKQMKLKIKRGGQTITLKYKIAR